MPENRKNFVKSKLVTFSQCGKEGTLWKFQDFCIAKILREINILASRSAKLPFFAMLWALKFANLIYFCLFKVQKFMKIKIQSL